MIIYVTKETAVRYGLKMPEELSSPLKESVASAIERESGDKMLEWGAKLFYFDRRKCLLITNFASRLTLFLIDVKVKDVENIGSSMADYMFDIYEDDPETTRLLKRFFNDDGIVVFSALKDKSMIATLNHTLTNHISDGDRLWDYIKNGILHTREFNKDFNREWILFKKVDGKTQYFYAAEVFAQLLKDRYADRN